MTHSFSTRGKLLALAAVIGVSGTLTACAPVLVGGVAATTAMVATDRRTVGQQVTDKEINLKVDNDLQVKFGKTARINASSYDGVVLLTGDAFSEKIRGEAAAIAASVPQVKSVINRLYVGPLASFSQITSDTWLASKVKTTLLTTEGIPYGAIVVSVERDDVYLQGLVTQAEADKIAEVVASVGGVKKVFTLFDIMTPEQAAALNASKQPQSGLPSSNPTPTGVTDRAGGTNINAPAGAAPGAATTVEPVQAPSSPQARPL
ncbi:BON domain-containing protein [Orrella daihaiensis]|uniref:BON domain-containing protein n=1 Tax=Orrella daihaiensis TaxID=2782176 RepID=A0ABY4AM04_9BURK|nr:BON domain-containing protein [Orrella daihaiensis]UOD50651.1 BON domain-containing protein [Orrella daihaiensis]